MSSQMLPGINRSTIIQIVAIYLVVAAIFNLCGGALAITGGTFAGLAGVASVAGVPFDESGELAGAAAGLGALGGLLIVLGIIGLILAPVMLVGAVGLFQRRRWSRMLTVVIAGISAVTSLLALLFGAGIGQVIWLALGAFVAYFFYTDAEIQRELVN
jgi:hypothetical protein